MSQRPFVDFYEVLQLSPRATTDMVERVYRFLAKRYHPDNQMTGDPDRFATVQDAYDTLSHPERRAAFDVKYDEVQNVQWKVFDQQSAGDGREEDRRIMYAILSLLYIERRRNTERGGLGQVLLERMLGVPDMHLEFPIWYMKQRGWIELLSSGEMAITANGIDRMSDKDFAVPNSRLLTGSTAEYPSSDTAERSSAADPRLVIAE